MINALCAQLKLQWQLLCLAVMFFTRVPVAKSIPYSPERMNKATRYFSLVGLLLGLLICIFYLCLRYYFSPMVTIVLIMAASSLSTGALHEDGLADMVDGIGGAVSKEQRLVLMKDSRIGTFGSVSLVFILLLKFSVLVELASLSLFLPSVLLGYALSRAIAASLIINTPYAGENNESKSKALVLAQSSGDLAILLLIGFFPVLLLISDKAFFSLLIKLVIILGFFRTLFRRWLLQRINGFTGDCLGAAQQLSEVLIYLIIIAHFAKVDQHSLNLVTVLGTSL